MSPTKSDPITAGNPGPLRPPSPTSRSWLDAVLSAAPVGIAFLDPDLRYLHVNETLARISGVPVAAHLGRTVREVYPDSAPGVEPELRRVLENGEAILDQEVVVEDSTESARCYAMSFYPVRADALRGIGVTMTDITERKRAEARLRESEDRFKSAFEHAAIGMALVRRDGRFLQVNRVLCEILGYTEAEMLTRRFQGLTFREDLPLLLKYRRQIFRGEIGDFQMEKRYQHKQGHPVWTLLSASLIRDAQGRPDYFISQIQDITARKRTEEALEASERRFREVLETTQIVAVAINRLGRVTFCNDYLLRLTGRERAEVLGRDWFNTFLPPEIQETARAVFLQSLEREETLLAREERPLVTRSGERRLIAWNNTLVHDREGRIVNATMIGEDITDRRRLELELSHSLQRERHIAETMQRSLLLKKPDPIIAGLEIDTFYLPASDEAQVGGDFFDVFSLDGERIALVLGDASGKGLRAAARVVEVKFALRAFMREYPHPARTLSRLNDFIYNSMQLEKRDFGPFVVLSLAVVNTATGEVFLSCAGSETPLILREDGSGEVVEATGLPLCIQAGEHYETAHLYLAPGDLIVMATDGFTEARRGKQFLGTDGLLRLAQEAHALGSLRAIRESIVEGARAFTTRGAFTDDACLLLARL